jgi:hypothetical protein
VVHAASIRLGAPTCLASNAQAGRRLHLQHGLANVWVSVSSPSTGTYKDATTAADGTYTVSGLAAGTDYQVCFSATGATGGTSDALGYVDQCYDSQLMPGTPTPAAVSAGAATTAGDAALGVALP